jgi:hypothetical protein
LFSSRRAVTLRRAYQSGGYHIFRDNVALLAERR